MEGAGNVVVGEAFYGRLHLCTPGVGSAGIGWKGGSGKDQRLGPKKIIVKGPMRRTNQEPLLAVTSDRHWFLRWPL